jgi:hypothetical protein
MLPAKFGLIWPRSFRGEDFLTLANQKQELLLAAIFVGPVHLVPFGQQTWPPRTILFSDWLMLNKSSPLKLLGQMEPNLAGSIYVRSSIKFLRFFPFGQQLYRGPYIDASCQDWLHLAKQFQKRFF